MTHTHHRRGSRASLQHDFVVLAMIDPAVTAQHTYGGPLRRRVRQFLEICGKHNPTALAARTPEKRIRYLKGWAPTLDSGIHHAASLKEIMTCEDIEGIGHAVYTSKEAVVGVLQELKEADLGLSIVVSGLFEEVFDACDRGGLAPHTVNMSLGTWGKTQLLPKSPILEICTMCGHAMISPNLVTTMFDRVKKGAIAPEDAAVELGKQCTCNIFNTARAVELLSTTTLAES